MSALTTPFSLDIEPDEGNIRFWLESMIQRASPIEKARWNEAQIDSLFYAGSQEVISRIWPQATNQQNKFFFNLVKTPVELITGYQRQHRKSVNFIPSQNSDSKTTDQYTRLVTETFNRNGINDVYSKACELAAVSGMVLMQPYLDFENDPAQGEFKVKIWESNSFLTDPFFRNSDMSDCGYVICQEYMTKDEAMSRFPNKQREIQQMAPSPQRFGEFYFLPEMNSMNSKDLFIASYVWYRKRNKKKMVYSLKNNQFYNFGKNANLDMILNEIPDLQVINKPANQWNLCVVLNEKLMWKGPDPLQLSGAPFVPMFWNYDPHLNRPELRVRSFVYPMRSAQYLFNRRVTLNHDISECSINTGYKRKVGAVANEDNLKMTGQGWDILINDEYQMTDVEKIIPNAVPPSDMELAMQMREIVMATSSVNLENWSAQQDKQASSFTTMIKQAANLLVFQKYFDQWDFSLKLLGEKALEIMIGHWEEAKIKMLLGEEPTFFFFSKIFAHYRTIVAEGLDTATQKQQEFMQWTELNQMTGGVIPPSEIAKRATIQGRDELVAMLQQQEQMQAAQGQHAQQVASMLEDAKVKELYSKAAANVGLARERSGRDEANLGLFQERLSEISQNRASATKAKVEAMEKLLQLKTVYGEKDTLGSARAVGHIDSYYSVQEDYEEDQAKKSSESNELVLQLLQGLGGGQQQQQQQPIEQGV